MSSRMGCSSRTWPGPRDGLTGYYVAHTVLIIVNLLIAALLGTWGYRAYKASRSTGVKV